MTIVGANCDGYAPGTSGSPVLREDGRAVGVISTDKYHFVALEPQEPDEDVRLDCLKHVAEMEGAVGIREGGGYDYLLL